MPVLKILEKLLNIKYSPMGRYVGNVITSWKSLERDVATLPLYSVCPCVCVWMVRTKIRARSSPVYPDPSELARTNRRHKNNNKSIGTRVGTGRGQPRQPRHQQWLGQATSRDFERRGSAGALGFAMEGAGREKGVVGQLYKECKRWNDPVRLCTKICITNTQSPKPTRIFIHCELLLDFQPFGYVHRARYAKVCTATPNDHFKWSTNTRITGRQKYFHFRSYGKTCFLPFRVDLSLVSPFFTLFFSRLNHP